MNELSKEDALRLNVLVASAQAVRIDENAMTVFGLSGEKEMRVGLNPNCRTEKYLSLVREMLSGTVLGSPGGYPVFLRRWTRTGQINNAQLDKLLMLGEPEAALAVARAPILTEELARRAWWAAASPELGRCLLENPRLVGTRIGQLVAEYLIEYLPFEAEHRDMLETIRLVLQPGLISDETRQRLWESGRMKKTYRVGFLETVPDELPEPTRARADFDAHCAALEALADGQNRCAALLLKVLSAKGQTFLEVAADIIRRPADQEVVSAWLNAVGRYFGSARRCAEELREVDGVLAEAERCCGEASACHVAAALPALKPELKAMLVLAHIDEAIVTPIFAHTDAVGSLMRKKIEPIISLILDQFAILRGRSTV